MSDTKYCILCGEDIPWEDIKCKYCGTNQVLEEKQGFNIFANMTTVKEKQGFSDEEILALGLYPKDEKYKMSLISRILD